MDNKNTQTGNVLFLILIAVALFAALSYAITQSTRGGGDTNKETSKIELASAYQQNSSIVVAIMRLKFKGCTDEELSFWNDSDGDNIEDSGDNYYNPNSPIDRSCHIFWKQGGGVNNADYRDFFPLQDGETNIQYRFSGSLNYASSKTSDPDLSIYVRRISDDFCRQVNIDNGLGDTLNPGGGSCVPGMFEGVFSLASCSDSQVGPNNEFCNQQSGVNTYYKLLIDR